MPVRLVPPVTLAGFACWLLLAGSTSWFGVRGSPAPDAETKRPTPPVATESLVLSTLTEHQTHQLAHEQLLRDIAANVNGLLNQRGELAQRLDEIDRQLATAARDRESRLISEPPEIVPTQPPIELIETQADMARVAQEIAELRGDIQALSQKLTEREPSAVVAPELLTTKLYRPQQLRGSQLEPLIVPLLTPGVGVWGAAAYPGDETDAILVRDFPDVMAKIDRLIAELDRPLPGLEFDVFLQQVDRTTGLPRSLAIPVPTELFGNDGASLLVPESVISETDAASINRDRPANSPAISEESGDGSIRVLRITPRLVR